MIVRSVLLGCAGAALVLSVAPETAAGCSIQPVQEFEMTYSATTSETPPAVRLMSYQLERGCGAGPGSGNCADVGGLHIMLAPEDGADLDAYGALVRVQSGNAPLPIDPDRPILIEGSGIRFAFHDGHGQPPIDFTITVQAVDRSGTPGVESQPMRIAHEGGNAICCECVTPGGSRGGLASLMLGLLFPALLLFSRRMRVAANDRGSSGHSRQARGKVRSGAV